MSIQYQAKLLTRMYPKPAYKESATFCGVPTPEVRSFRHIPVPLVKYDTLCKNYELALHIASSQDTKRLIKVSHYFKSRPAWTISSVFRVFFINII